jgi:hypothetical protein
VRDGRQVQRDARVARARAFVISKVERYTARMGNVPTTTVPKPLYKPATPLVLITSLATANAPLFLPPPTTPSPTI